VEPVEPLRELRRTHGGQGGERHGRRAHESPAADAVRASLKRQRAILVRVMRHHLAREVPAVGHGIGEHATDRAMPKLGICRASATACDLKPSRIRCISFGTPVALFEAWPPRDHAQHPRGLGQATRSSLERSPP
jgi:hypothetical protein